MFELVAVLSMQVFFLRKWCLLEFHLFCDVGLSDQSLAVMINCCVFMFGVGFFFFFYSFMAAADLDDWTGLEETSSSFQPPLRSLPVQPEFWNRVEDATREIIENVHPTLVSEDRRRDVIDYMQRLIRMTLGCEVHFSLKPSLLITLASGNHVP